MEDVIRLACAALAVVFLKLILIRRVKRAEW
jgi:hypothetical protein